MQVKRSVGRYELLEQIGRGGMGIVYLARQTDLGRMVAVKELGAFDSPDRAAAQRFVHEARLAGSLSHSNIVTVHDFFEYAGRPYIAMEYLPRGSLRRHMRSLTLARAAGVFEGLLAGLAYAEQRGIVHRDLKPENLLLSAEGRIKIADFGVAKATREVVGDTYTTVSGTTLGTPAYMAPEQAVGEQIGPWTDLYGVGVIAYELFAGRVPFAGSDMAVMVRHMHDPVPPIDSLNAGVHPEIADWIERLLIKDPAQRTRSATTAWNELEEIVLELLGPRWRRHAQFLESDDPSHVGDRADTGPATPPPSDLPAGPMMPTEPAVAVGPSTPTWRLPSVARRARPRRRTLAIAGAGLLAAIAVVAITLSGGGDKPAARPLSLDAGRVHVDVPAGWRRTSALGAGALLELVPAAGAAPGGVPARGTVTLGIAPDSASNSSLLPSAFRRSVVGDPAASRSIDRGLRGGLQAYRYVALQLAEGRAALTVYAAPTSVGVATLACAAPTPAATCDAIAHTLSVAGAKPFAVGPSPAYARLVNRSLRSLRRALAPRAARLGSQSSATGQARAATSISRAYADARKPLASARPSPADVAANKALITAMRQAVTAYASLARAARAIDGSAYARAAARARRAHAAVGATLRNLRSAGYGSLVTERHRPHRVAGLRRPAPAAPPAVAPLTEVTVTPPALPPPPPAKQDPVFAP